MGSLSISSSGYVVWEVLTVAGGGPAHRYGMIYGVYDKYLLISHGEPLHWVFSMCLCVFLRTSISCNTQRRLCIVQESPKTAVKLWQPLVASIP